MVRVGCVRPTSVVCTIIFHLFHLFFHLPVCTLPACLPARVFLQDLDIDCVDVPAAATATLAFRELRV